MSSKEDSPFTRVQMSFQQLSTAASTLNAISDQLGKVVSRLDSSFQKLNIGVSGWVRFHNSHSGDGMQFWFDEVGYDKVNGKWGLAIRSASGHEAMDEYSSYEEWLFNDAPRALRIDAVDKIPELFEKLTNEVTASTRSVDKKLKQLEEFASAVSAVVGTEKPPTEVTCKR
jgi:hypothetical protein